MKTIGTTLAIICFGMTANAATYTPTPMPNSQFNSPYKGKLVMDHDEKPKKDLKKDEKYKKMLEQTKDLEAVLVSVMIEPMFPRGKESGLYGGGNSSDIYRSMMIQQYGKILSKGNSMGLAENIAKNLTK